MGNEISESGWTMYLDQSIDSWSNKISNEFDIHKRYKEPAEKNPSCQYRASSIGGKEEDSSIASVASSRPQKAPLPAQDIEPEQDLQRPRFYSSLSKRKRVHHVNDGEHLECIASCTSKDVNPRRNKLRKLNKHEDQYEDADLLLQDTASSHPHTPESGVETEAHTYQNLQLPADTLGNIEEEDVNTRLETLRSLLPDAAKIPSEGILEVAIEYIGALKRKIQTLQIIGACTKYSSSHISIGCPRGWRKCSFHVPCYFPCKENATASVTATGGVHKHHIQCCMILDPPIFTPSAYFCENL